MTSMSCSRWSSADGHRCPRISGPREGCVGQHSSRTRPPLAGQYGGRRDVHRAVRNVERRAAARARSRCRRFRCRLGGRSGGRGRRRERSGELVPDSVCRVSTHVRANIGLPAWNTASSSTSRSTSSRSSDVACRMTTSAARAGSTGARLRTATPLTRPKPSATHGELRRGRRGRRHHRRTSVCCARARQPAPGPRRQRAGAKTESVRVRVGPPATRLPHHFRKRSGRRRHSPAKCPRVRDDEVTPRTLVVHAADGAMLKLLRNRLRGS